MPTHRQLPYPLGAKEERYLLDALHSGHLHGDGPYGKRCEAWLEQHHGSAKALLTPSCTAALEATALLAGIQPGDEVIMPSYTFVSTANAFALRGAVPVFVDVDPRTSNIDPAMAAAAIGPRTRALVCVHYAGVACDMDALSTLCDAAGIVLIEDAAQAIGCSYRGKPLGNLGRLGALSFHQTKNLGSGEGGALLIRDTSDIRPAQFIREKGTNRIDFVQGRVDKYTWVTLGSSYLPSELQAAMLWAQLEDADTILARRLTRWETIHHHLADAEAAGRLERPWIPDYASHKGHIYRVTLPSQRLRDARLAALQSAGIAASTHFVPLHSSPGGQRYGRAADACAVSTRLADTTLRIPTDRDLTAAQLAQIATLLGS